MDRPAIADGGVRPDTNRIDDDEDRGGGGATQVDRDEPDHRPERRPGATDGSLAAPVTFGRTRALRVSP